MENVIIHNNKPLVVVPLDHREVMIERPSTFVYDSMRDRIERDLPKIDSFLSMIRPFCYHEIFGRIPSHTQDPSEPFLENRYFMNGDARAAYGIIAATHPKRIVEIGSGNSTKFIRRSIRDFGLSTHLTSIDPVPRAAIDKLCDVVVRRSVLTVDLEIFRQLGDGDILFHDGSHLTFNGTDTVRLFLEILTVIQPGVLIHIHDICLPFEYAPCFDGRGYSEQYMLATLLLYSRQFEILLPVAYLSGRKSFDGGVSFWFRKTA